VPKKEHWEKLLGPDYLNFFPTYKRLLEMGATDQMVYESLKKVLAQEFFIKISPRQELLFRKRWRLDAEKFIADLGKIPDCWRFPLSRTRRGQINKKTEQRLCAETGFPKILRIRVKQALYQDILEKIMQ